MRKIAVIVMMLFAYVSFGQNKNAKASLEVDGVCQMCKDRIEKACIKTKGVKSAIWNVKTHELKVIFDERKTNLDAIESSVAAVGYDTKNLKAPDEVYNSLHACCFYRDIDVQEDHKE